MKNDDAKGSASCDDALDPGAAPYEVVAVALTWRGKVGLFKRSSKVSHDRGLWHCITGRLERANEPLIQATIELAEETGLNAVNLLSFEPGPVLHLRGESGDLWTVHTFVAQTEVRRLTLNWEHDSFRWTSPRNVSRIDGQVPWLRDVLIAVALTKPR